MENSMLISSSTELKFHVWSKINNELDEENESDYLYQPTPLISSSSTRITSLSLSTDGTHVGYLSENRQPEIISLRDKNNIKLVHTITAINSAVKSLKFQRKTKRIVALGTTDGQLFLYDTKRKMVDTILPNIGSSINYVDFNSKDQLLAISCEDGNNLICNINEEKYVDSFALKIPSKTTALRYHPHEPYTLMAASEDGYIIIWDTNESKKKFLARIHNAPVYGLTASNESNLVITVGLDNKFCIHDMNNLECVFRSSLNTPLTAVDINWNGIEMAIGTEEGCVYLYDIRNLLQPIVTWKQHKSIVTNLTFDKSGGKIRKDDVSSKTAFCNSLLDIGDKYQARDDCSLCQDDVSSIKDQKDEEYFLEMLNKFKKDIVEQVAKDMQDIQKQMEIQSTNWENFIEKELERIDQANEECWNLVVPASNLEGKENDGFSTADERTFTEIF